jgi:diguanylate cyclase (GGDEF)-like protein
MGAAHTVLFINIAVAMLFACAYVAVAWSLPSQRKALWFALTYCIGILKPLADAVIPLVAFPTVLEWLGYGAFLAALLMMSPALRLFHDQPAGWRTPALIMLGGLTLRALIFTWDRTSFAHGVAYQTPFFAAAVFGCRTAMSLPKAPQTKMILSGLFAVLALQFAVKPWIAVSVGAGRTLADYVASTYALISQASTGIVLMAVGLTLLVLVVQRAITASTELAETDPLSGLLNRRGLERQSVALLQQHEVVALLIDLDHFKRINDCHGHAVGDQVIVNFARAMRCAAPSESLLARLGGEEFAILAPGSIDSGLALAEAIRATTMSDDSRLPVVTASIGVATTATGGALETLLRRADDAAYDAKRQGRDRVAAAPLALLAA